MKHAIMVMGFGKNADILQQTINVLDDDDIDFIIHWDKKYKIPHLESRKSRITFISRIKVRWGTDTQTFAERRLMENVCNCNIKYDYCHLISSSDAPLMTARYFKKYFKKDSFYIGFTDFMNTEMTNRMKYYYPVRYLRLKNKYFGTFIFKTCKLFNKLFKVNRIDGFHIERGCNWFSMDIKYVKQVLNFKHFEIFKNVIFGDENYIQTVLYYLKPKKLTNKYDYFTFNYRMSESSKMALRYIDWYRGMPYTFQYSDSDELSSLINTKYAFVRKIYDVNIIKKIFNY
ncbi:beta-1,6-N-acetylglucosaminyltransferase [Apilactobacillus timberlakei]|uniref:beta-1,6-N-acetylglucosaminyltransferase n=1 Tax=Apilactobacillus timberlakei TaxID=2008380 RepID=UPI00112E4EDE|nr:beta-1,6-N-acetylglucosaminyltransferase [Apilactobacillus timberlakei]TPR14811.1 hypothetical protein DYZ97_01365 [Apilactobacillus timberlakei]